MRKNLCRDVVKIENLKSNMLMLVVQLFHSQCEFLAHEKITEKPRDTKHF